jgi:hypothetical protein
MTKRPSSIVILDLLCASACPGATAFEPEKYYGETAKKLSESLIICNTGLGQGILVDVG